MARCPHDDVIFCPLYRVSHHGVGVGCDDGHLDRGGCAVTRGMSYKREVARLNPKFVAAVASKEGQQRSSEQRKRNMRGAAVH